MIKCGAWRKRLYAGTDHHSLGGRCVGGAWNVAIGHVPKKRMNRSQCATVALMHLM
jgi:hypothetical protein